MNVKARRSWWYVVVGYGNVEKRVPSRLWSQSRRRLKKKYPQCDWSRRWRGVMNMNAKQRQYTRWVSRYLDSLPF